MNNDWIYYGLFLTNKSRENLIKYLKSDNVPEEVAKILKDNNVKLIIDHCTLLHISQIKDNIKLSSYLNELYKHSGNYFIPIGITAIGYSDKAVAFKCILPLFKEMNICANKIPHITICTLNDGKPVDSNNITNWIKIDFIYVYSNISRV